MAVWHSNQAGKYYMSLSSDNVLIQRDIILTFSTDFEWSLAPPRVIYITLELVFVDDLEAEANNNWKQFYQ